MAAARPLFALAALAALIAIASSGGQTSRFIDLDPWAWLPTKRTKSASIMDYFFPPSRTPKVSNLESMPLLTSSLLSTTEDAKTTTMADRPSTITTQDARTTTKKTSTAGKIKTTLTQTTPKTKQSSSTNRNAEAKTTKSEKVEKLTTAMPSSTKSISTPTKNSNPPATKSSPSSTQRPTKHYTIIPLRSSATPKPTTQYIPDTTLDSDTSVQEDSKTASIPNYTTSTNAPSTSDTSQSSSGIPSTASESRVTANEPQVTSDETRVTSTETRVTSGETRVTSDETRVTSGESRATTHRFTHTTPESTDTTDGVEPTTFASDGNATDDLDSREGYLPLRDKPQETHVKINDQTKKESVPLPAGSTNVLAKPTKYHYYPHNQHIYLLPECAIQQVCNAVYVRLNYTQPLCACPSRYRDPCSASLNADDLHTTRLTTDSKKKYANRAITLVKTCEAVSEMRECRAPRDWSLLALQNIRTGKSHYLVICRCPENHILEGPMSHDQPTYASVPGIRVYGMMCVRPTSATYHTSGYNANRYTAVSIQSTTSAYKVDYSQPHYNQDKPVYNRYPSHSYLGPNTYYNRMSRAMRTRRHIQRDYPPFPWHKVKSFAQTIEWE